MDLPVSRSGFSLGFAASKHGDLIEIDMVNGCSVGGMVKLVRFHDSIEDEGSGAVYVCLCEVVSALGYMKEVSV